MYRYTWFDKRNYRTDIKPAGVIPDGWIRKEDIKEIRLSAWEEHCLECAPPECYGHCGMWLERYDKKCKKTTYGIKQRADIKTGCGYAVQLKFRPWGKIQTNLYKGCMNPLQIRIYERLWFFFDMASLWISKIFHAFLPKCTIAGGMEVFKNFTNGCLGGKKAVASFLFQCYSEDEKEYRLFIELLERGRVYYRESIWIKKGYNQCLMNIRDLDIEKRIHPQIRYYPEKDYSAELLIIMSECVNLKEGNTHLHNQESLAGQVKEDSPAKKVKCVAWDLDNTIWDGILMEAEPADIDLREHVRDVIRQLDERGIIQIIVSKNDQEDVMPVLRRLGIEDFFVCILANWNRKSVNIKLGAQKLNININTFAFIDDSAFERGEVKDALPMVRIYDETEVMTILDYPEFDVPVTDDSRNRRKMYQEESKRMTIQEQYCGDDQQFLKDCKIEVSISNISDDTRLRSYELVQRTNQLNLSGRKFTMDEFEQYLCNTKNKILVFSCQDKYGAYGQVGFLELDIEDRQVWVREFAMSCRVADKHIEPALLKWIKEKYHPIKIVFDGVYNSKNQRLIHSLKRYGLTDKTRKEHLMMEADSENIVFDEIVKIIDNTDGQ